MWGLWKADPLIKDPPIGIAKISQVIVIYVANVPVITKFRLNLASVAQNSK